MAIDTIKNSKQKRFILRTWHIAVTLIALVIVAVIAASAYFVWDRWDRYDDTTEIQGEWYVLGTKIPIKITQDVLDFNADTSYHYMLDPETKTITFTLGNMEGLAHYCFFEDRQVLMILDGKDFTQWGTAGEDLLVSLQSFVSLSSGRIPQYPQGDGIIVLSRTPDKFGWGNYKYAFKQAEDEPVPEPEDASSGSEPDNASGPSGDSSIPADEQPSNPDEGTPREDDPFGFVSDTPSDAPFDGSSDTFANEPQTPEDDADGNGSD